MKLNINTAVCDIRKIDKKTLNKYEEIRINAAAIISNSAAQEKTTRIKCNFNAASFINSESGRVIVKNGIFTIGENSGKGNGDILIVNGKMNIEKGSEDTLRSYEKIIVNGSLLCPKGLAAEAAIVSVNGNSKFYDDEAVLFEDNIDKIFALRACEGEKFFCPGTIIVSCTEEVGNILYEKKISIDCQAAYIPTPLLEVFLPIFTRSSKIVEIPEGCELIEDDVVLDKRFAGDHGNKLYVIGNIHIAEPEMLQNISYLYAEDTIYCPMGNAARLRELGCKEIISYSGTLLWNSASIEITADMLKNAEKGLSIYECAVVNIAEDVSPELIKERLVIGEAAVVNCSALQREAAKSVSEDVAVFGDGDKTSEDGTRDTDTVSAAFYEF